MPTYLPYSILQAAQATTNGLSVIELLRVSASKQCCVNIPLNTEKKLSLLGVYNTWDLESRDVSSIYKVTFSYDIVSSLLAIPSFTYSFTLYTSTIYLFTDSHIHFFLKFSFKTLKQTQFICIHVTTMRMT